MDPHYGDRRPSYPTHQHPAPPSASPSHPPPHSSTAPGHYPPPSASPAVHDHRLAQAQPHQPPPPGHPYPHGAPPPVHSSYQQLPAQPGPVAHQYSHQGPPPPQHRQPTPPQYGGLPPPSTAGPALPPIQTPSEHGSLPSFRDPSAQPHDPRRGSQEHSQQYNAHARSGHGTPAGVGRPSYASHERTPTTPSIPQAFPTPPQPPSAGSEHAHNAPPPPPGHGLPPQHMMDHSGHLNGYSAHDGGHGMPYQPPPMHPMGAPPYMAQMPMAEPHQPYGPSPVYHGASYASSTQLGKRKQMRATQACEQCRQRKQKCDEGSPCSFCKENNLSCNYRDTPPQKTDKNMEKLLSYMETHANSLAELTAKISGFNDRLRRLEGPNSSSLGTEEQAINNAGNLDEQEESPKKRTKLGDHRTPPHKLILLWPSVRPLLQAAGIRLSEGYVMEAEDRGMLRMWTSGEVVDELNGTTVGDTPSSPAKSEEGAGASAISPARDRRWNAGLPPMPGPRGQEQTPSAGGRRTNGALDLDVGNLNTMYDSFMRHMFILHPFLEKRRLRRLFDGFCRRYGTGQSRATFAVGTESADPDKRPMKRQRSNGSSAIPTANSYDQSGRRESSEAIERSPSNAIILLVLALGKICLHKEPLPGLARDSLAQQNAQLSRLLTTRSGQSTVDGSFSSISSGASDFKVPGDHAQPTPPTENRSHMVPATHDSQPNMDAIPGLAYYAKATEILGEQADGNDIVHAQMFLLAGLYKGQLARVRESLSWITMAGRVTLMLLDRYKLYNDNYWTAHGDIRKVHQSGQARIKDSRAALIVMISWTCLQLESDILAELKYPPSGIQTLDNMLLMPNTSNEATSIDEMSYDGLEQDDPTHEDDLLYYCAQLFLRRRLNQVHTEIYGPDCLEQPLAEVREMLRGHESILAAWRKSLPEQLAWEDDDPAPDEILAARLRAKYWGARYVSNRPFLDYALHIMPHVKGGMSVEQAARDAHGNPRDQADIRQFLAIQQMSDSEVLQAAKRCIDAAMHSTVAFDNIKGRLIVTNIHGTAHAQFGNMLVLATTYHTSYLREMVDAPRFQALLVRTIKFLRVLAPLSPTSQIDCLILERFNDLLFPTDLQTPLSSAQHGQAWEAEGGVGNADTSPARSFHP